MAAFDLSGNVKWNVPNFTPLVATADGGVVAQSTDGMTTSTSNAKRQRDRGERTFECKHVDQLAGKCGL
jgi:hypothetical protein